MASPSDVVKGRRLTNAEGTQYRADGQTGSRQANPKAFRQTNNTYRVTASPGYSVFLLPWSASFSNTNWATRTQSNTVLSGCVLATSSTAQNNEVVWNIWLDSGTYKVALLYLKDTDQGIHNLQFTASTQGTVDAYAAAPSSNNYTEVTGIAVVAGLKVFRDLMATKNASSSAYGGKIQSVAWIRTGA